MSSQQTLQEKKAWKTPEVVVLTRDGDSTGSVLRACKGGVMTESRAHNNDCHKVYSMTDGCSSCKEYRVT